ncbi:hypothetical protein FI667_g4967, partial [Globisporangium splendens]
MEVVGVGIVAVDVIDEVAEFPKGRSGSTGELLPLDGDEFRPDERQRSGVCALGTREIGRRLRHLHDPAHRIHANVVFDCTICFKYILSSRATGSRTIVHSRDLEELSVADFQRAFDRFVAVLSSLMSCTSTSVTSPMWFHFEGRNMEPVLRMMQYVRANAPPKSVISVEIEALRYDWALARKLVASADFAFVSKDYIRDKLGYDSAACFMEAEFKKLQVETAGSLKALISPWGADGVYYLTEENGDQSKMVRRIPTRRLDQVVESIGAGDTFIGASIAAMSRGLPLDVALRMACEVATSKCLQVGLSLPHEACKQWVQAMRTYTA